MAGGAIVAVAVAPRAGAVSPIVTGTDTGTPTHVKAFDGLTLAEQASFLPYPGFTGGVRVAVGDVTGDGRGDFVTGAGAGAPGHVKVFNGQTLGEVHSFFAYDAGFTGGVYVAAGDLTGDGRADLIASTDESGAGAGSVRVFDAVTLAQIRSFVPYGRFTGGVRVGAGDVTGDGVADIITGTGPGAAHVKVFDGVTGAEVHSFLPYAGFTGGIFVAGETPVPEPALAGCALSFVGFVAMRRPRRAPHQ